jgi:hypothetical protein
VAPVEAKEPKEVVQLPDIFKSKQQQKDLFVAVDSDNEENEKSYR